MDPSTPFASSRSASFMAGRFGSAYANSGLAAVQSRQSAMIPGGYRASGTNQQITPSGVGDSSADAARRTYGGGYVPSQNGIAANTYTALRPLMNPSLGVANN